jgi:hypothetical protein
VKPLPLAVKVASEKLLPSSSLPKINDSEPDRIPEFGLHIFQRPAGTDFQPNEKNEFLTSK